MLNIDLDAIVIVNEEVIVFQVSQPNGKWIQKDSNFNASFVC